MGMGLLEVDEKVSHDSTDLFWGVICSKTEGYCDVSHDTYCVGRWFAQCRKHEDGLSMDMSGD